MMSASPDREVERLTHDEVPLCGLGVPDLLVERVVRQVGLGEQASIPKCLGDLQGIRFERSGDGYDDDLTRRQPEWPKKVRPTLSAFRIVGEMMD